MGKDGMRLSILLYVLYAHLQAFTRLGGAALRATLVRDLQSLAICWGVPRRAGWGERGGGWCCKT